MSIQSELKTGVEVLAQAIQSRVKPPSWEQKFALIGVRSELNKMFTYRQSVDYTVGYKEASPQQGNGMFLIGINDEDHVFEFEYSFDDERYDTNISKAFAKALRFIENYKF
ncbi:hypothetical protein CEW46_27665 [Bacillus cereus]|nr:hypothetical protein CEW46_27665 [Bacillus cereus]